MYGKATCASSDKGINDFFLTGGTVNLDGRESKFKPVFKNLVKKRQENILNMQDYLRDPQISINQAKTLFGLRTWMERFGENVPTLAKLA